MPRLVRLSGQDFATWVGDFPTENWIKMTDTSSLKKTSENPQEGAEGSRFDQDGLTASQAQERVDIPFKVAWLFHSKLHVFFHWYSPQP